MSLCYDQVILEAVDGTFLMRKLVVWVLVIGALIAAWQSMTRRSVAVPLGSSGYELAFTTDLGLGMDQKFKLRRSWLPWSADSSHWIEIIDKPYYSGATLYVSDDGATYYVSAGYILIIVVPDEGKLETTCFDDALPRRTPLADLLLISDSETREQFDPGAPLSRGDYIRTQDQDAALPDPPPPSRYYQGVQYIGRFGATKQRGSWRGVGVGFAPATLAPEPRLGLEFSCG